ncbi:MAG: nucleoside deaminase [Pyrinomonadaceae bacterium]
MDEKFMNRAIELARQGMDSNIGGPFGAVVVKDGRVIGEGYNQVTSSHDPTAHAEIVAIRAACKVLNSFQLDECVIYTSCEPCPMCLGAIYWARMRRVFIACSREDAAGAGFDDQFIYEEINSPISSRTLPVTTLMRDEALAVFSTWKGKADKTEY